MSATVGNYFSSLHAAEQSATTDIAKIVLSFISNCFNVYFPAAKLLVDSTAGNTPILVF